MGAGMALAALAAVAGCAQFDAALGQRQAIVSFRDNTPVSAKTDRALDLCEGTGGDRAATPVGPLFPLCP